MTRRALLAAGGATVLAACTSRTSSSPSTTRVVLPPSSTGTDTGNTTGTPAGTSLRLLIPPESITDPVLDRIAAQLQVPLVIEVYADPAFVIDRLVAQQGTYQYDVVVAPGAFLPAAIQAGLLRKIDPASIPGLAGQLDSVKASPFDPNSEYSVCKEVGYTGYAWDRTVLPQGIASWSDFVAAAARPEVSGKVTCLAEGAELLAIASWADGARTGADFDTDAAAAFVQQQLRPHLLDLDSGASVRMAEGSVVLAQMWNGEGRRLVQADPQRWGFAIGGPVTGVWMERFVIPASAPNPELGAAFIDAMLATDVAVAQTTARGYNTGVAEAQPAIAALDGVAVPTGSAMFGDSKDYGERLLDASADELRDVVVGTITAVLATSPQDSTPTTTTTVPTAVTTTTAASTETTATEPPTTSTTVQLDRKGRRVLRPLDEGKEVLDLQQRLKALGFSLGRPDGQYGDLTLAAVMAFQRSQGLQTDGVVGTHTWDALDDPKPILSRDVNTRGVASNATSDAATHSSTAAPSGGRTWVKAIVYLDSFRDEFFDANGNLVGSFPNSPGVNGLTPTGSFRVYSRSARTFYTPNPAETMQWMVRFNGGVGFHSVPRINGVPQPTPLGTAPSSHGCIRHADDVAKRIYDNLADNALVVVRHG